MTTALLVDCLKITNWLEDRKKLTQDWYNYLKAAQDKIKILVKDHDSYTHYPQLRNYLIQNQHNFHYAHVLHFTQLLLNTDLAKDKNIIFGYSDKRVKQWTNLKKYMDGKLIGLLSCAKFIKQSLNFDIPGITKNIELLDNQVSALKRKIDYNDNTIYQQNKDMIQQKKTLEILKDNIEEEIINMISETPKMFNKFYQLTQQYKLQNLIVIYQKICQENGTTCQLPVLKHFSKNGDDFVDVYQRKQVNLEQLNQYKYQDFLKWKPQNQWQIQIDGNLVNRNNSIKSPKTLLSQRWTRQQILYNLNQLQYFFMSLQTEKNIKSAVIQTDGYLSTLLESQISTALNNITSLINYLNGYKFKISLQIKSSTKSYKQLVSKFNNYLKNINHLRNQIAAYRIQIKDMEKQRQNVIEKSIAIRKDTITTKKICENLLSELIKRQVRITGQVNKLE